MKLECSQYNDARRSFLVVKCSGNPGNYQYRMLAANRIDGLVPCSLRSIDGNDYLYYEVTSRQSLESMCGPGALRGEEVKGLLYALAAVGSGISRFLLDDSRILLREDFIFYDPDKKSWLFCYYPEPADESSGEKLLKYLADHTDPADTVTVSAINRLHSRAGQPNFFLTQEVLDGEFDGRISALELIERIERENMELQRQSRPRREDFEREDRKKPERSKSTQDEWLHVKATGRKKRRPVVLLMLSLGFLSAALACDVITVYAASSFGVRGRVLMRAAAIASLMLAAMAAVYGLFLSLKKDEAEDGNTRTSGNGSQPELIPTDEWEAESVMDYIGGYTARGRRES